MSVNLIESFEWNAQYNKIGHIFLYQNNVKTLKIISTKGVNVSSKIDINFNKLTSFKLLIENIQPEDNYVINLDGNPFNCDFSMHNVFYINDTLKQIKVDFQGSRCVQPQLLQNRLLNSLTRKELMCTTIGYFSNCTCFYKDIDQELKVNCSQLKLINPPDMIKDEIVSSTELFFDHLSLNLNDNLLINLPVIPEHFKFNITKISAINNKIAVVTSDSIADDLKFLDLRNNSLRYLSKEVIKKLKNLQTLSLSGNPWLCDCSSLDFFNNIKSIKHLIVDYDEVFCQNLEKKFDALQSYQVCFNWPLVSIIASILGLFGVISTLFYKFKKDIKIFLYAHNMCLWFVSEDELDEDKVYDAFICFTADDQHLVEDIIFELEKEENGYDCLVGIRDWPPGHMFAELVSYLFGFSNFFKPTVVI